MFGCRGAGYSFLGLKLMNSWILYSFLGKIYNTCENALYRSLDWEALFLKLSKNQPLIWVNFKTLITTLFFTTG